MLTKEQKTAIVNLINEEKERLGSFKAVATKCDVSEATLSQLRSGTYAADGDAIYYKIGIALGYSFDDDSWVIVRDVTNYKIIKKVLDDAKNERMFMGISHPSGGCKTSTADDYAMLNRRNAVFMVKCADWGARTFLEKIAHEIGANIPRGYVATSLLIDAISDTVKRMASQRPLLIIDQVNSLKPSAIRTFIHLYNSTEDMLGLVAMGTKNFEHEIKKGVRLNHSGSDEVDSRFGRSYIGLIGSTLSDTRKICAANGITDENMQRSVFEECQPIKFSIEEKTINVVPDIRRIKRVIKRERLKLRGYAA